jgi:hypothetical protein
VRDEAVYMLPGFFALVGYTETSTHKYTHTHTHTYTHTHIHTYIHTYTQTGDDSVHVIQRRHSFESTVLRAVGAPGHFSGLSLVFTLLLVVSN